MADKSWASSAHARRSMVANRSRDTKPELAVRRLVHARGFRYRVDSRPESDLRRTADLVFTRARVAVMIDGCFWHGCPEHCRMPVAHNEYWRAKILRNVERDSATTAELQKRGWTVLRFWEHEAPGAIATEVINAVTRQQ